MLSMRLHAWLANHNVQPAEQTSRLPPNTCKRCMVDFNEFRLRVIHALEFGRHTPPSLYNGNTSCMCAEVHSNPRCRASLQLCYAFSSPSVLPFQKLNAIANARAHSCKTNGLLPHWKFKNIMSAGKNTKIEIKLGNACTTWHCDVCAQ